MTTDVHHEEARQRFVVAAGDEEAVVEYTRPDERTIDLRRTFVPPSGRGQGLAGALVLAALEYARARGLRVVPTCPYVGRYVERHPAWADLLVDR